MDRAKIIISRSPAESDDLSRYAAIVNVSDSPCRVFTSGVPSFWFPIHETGEWGYSPFYGAAKVVDQFRSDPKPILFHCHAGANRSPSVAYAVLASDGVSDEEISSLYPLYGTNGMRDIYRRNVVPFRCVHNDTISMLAARHSHPTFSIVGLLMAIKSPHAVHSHYNRCCACAR